MLIRIDFFFKLHTMRKTIFLFFFGRWSKNKEGFQKQKWNKNPKGSLTPAITYHPSFDRSFPPHIHTGKKRKIQQAAWRTSSHSSGQRYRIISSIYTWFFPLLFPSIVFFFFWFPGYKRGSGWECARCGFLTSSRQLFLFCYFSFRLWIQKWKKKEPCLKKRRIDWK